MAIISTKTEPATAGFTIKGAANLNARHGSG
jgi:hypothetical protein